MEPVITPSLLTEIEKLRADIDMLKRVPRWRAVGITPGRSFGTDRGSGWRSINATAFSPVITGEATLSAPVLYYSLETSNDWESTAVTSISWQLQATSYSFADPDTPIISAAVASGVSTSQTWALGEETFTGQVDLTTFLGPEAMFKLLKIEVEILRTGGTGDVAVRLLRPLFLKLPDSPVFSIPAPTARTTPDPQPNLPVALYPGVSPVAVSTTTVIGDPVVARADGTTSQNLTASAIASGSLLGAPSLAHVVPNLVAASKIGSSSTIGSPSISNVTYTGVILGATTETWS